LGDKSNHIATIHLPQMLYIWPFFTFFSAPILYPFGLDYLFRIRSTYLYLRGEGIGPEEPLRKGIRAFRRAVTYRKYQPSLDWIACSLAITICIVHYNTIIHPFTLADNRHYVFYAFRYTILRHPLIRYMLAPVYLFCGWLVFRGLAGVTNLGLFGTQTDFSQNPQDQSILKDPSQNKTIGSNSTDLNEQPLEATLPGQQSPQPDGNNTSFALMWLIATTLSLITAPLVEPRYFIVPWVIWRLHVPAASLNSADQPKEALEDSEKPSVADFAKFWLYKGHDHRLWLETLWFLAINAVTGYVFLFKGFEWAQEPGNVQRFMW